MPVISFVDAKQDDGRLNLKFTVAGNEHTVSYALHEGFGLSESKKAENRGSCGLETSNRRFRKGYSSGMQSPVE